MAARPIISKWEFWPHWLFYLPVYFYVFWLALKSGNSTFFSLSNPSMKWGGLFSYSKYKALDRLPEAYRPKQLIISEKYDSKEVFRICKESKIEFPLIIKPDIGERGRSVSFIENQEGFFKYPNWQKEKLIIQEYINWPIEIGVFWIRDMQTNNGFISSLMERLLLKIQGNGKDNVYTLLLNHPRHKRFAKKVMIQYPEKSIEIPKLNETVLIEPIGNHSRGTIFLNAMNKIDSDLQSIMNKLLKPIEGFNYGRLDIRCKSWEDIKSGKNYKVLEINGANSEPAHIYQPDASLFNAYKSIFGHWKYLYEIAIHNQNNGMKSETLAQLYKAFREYIKKY